VISTSQTGFQNQSVHTPVVTVRDLQHSYRTGAVEALSDINLDIYEGEIFGLIGPDGAGKTTLLQILSGVMQQTDGVVEVLGSSPRDARLYMGYLIQRFSLYADLSVMENLRYAARLREVSTSDFRSRTGYYLSLLDLARFKDRPAGKLSGGMKQKLALCCTLIHQPQVVLLDEPTTGVDPVSRRDFWDILVHLAAAERITVIVATPYLDEAERCSRVALISKGVIQKCGTPSELKTDLGMKRLEVYIPKTQLNQAEKILRSADSVQHVVTDVQRFGDRLDVLTVDPEKAKLQICNILLQHGLHTERFLTDVPTLENTFVACLRHTQENTLKCSYPRIYKQKLYSQTAIGAKNLNKFFGNFHAVKKLNLDIQYGEVFGLLGANGAGKTTTIKMLCGLTSPSSGQVSLAGETSHLRGARVRQKLGYMSQKFTLYDDLTIEQNLEFYCGIYGVPRHHRRAKKRWVLQMSDLVGQQDRLVKDLPGGWKQMVAFGVAVMHEPRVLFLDEPTSGVDPLARREIWRWINEFADAGMTILVTTHYLEEAEQCSRLGFMVAGEIVTQGTPRQVKEAQPGLLIEWNCVPTQKAADELKKNLDPWRVSIFGSRLHTTLDNPDSQIPQLERRLQEVGVEVQGYRRIEFSLEDVFISIVERTRC
jgi:ABC-2 type transport system ATP-binding protein